VADLIARMCHVRDSLRGVSLLLHRLGFSPQPPAHRRSRRGRDGHLAPDGVAGGKTLAASRGAWLCFEDEAGQTLRPPKTRTWGRRGHTPVVGVSARGSGRISIAALVCVRRGRRSRLIFRMRVHRGRRGERRSFAETDYAALLDAAHQQLGGPIVLIWDNLKCATRRYGIEWRWKDSTAGQSQLIGEAEGSRGVGTHVAAGSSPDNVGTGWHCQTIRAQPAVRRRRTRGTAV